MPLAPTGIVISHCIRPFAHTSIHLSVCPSVRPECHYQINSLMISTISLKFGGMMHSTMEQITI